MIRAVIDSNVLVSAACLPLSLPARLVELWLDGAFDVNVSRHALDEFADVIRRPKIRNRYNVPESRIGHYVAILTEPAIHLTPDEIPNAVPGDPNDNHIVGCAVKVRAEYIVSGDKHLLRLGQYGDIRIVTPAELLSLENLLNDHSRNAT